ncbi:hypothetical protein C922_01944 [Plasmodium inui San Antonio 1]|uniref:Inner membrane complex protein n=1 Tax=Plasmodium inui San Antonio 1 TaxID=1237626 RepID=W7A7W8_9APIC|nr:hypothetical protein C922_01944 [Plasmodium inui San Antonio 1]EUD67755.1 hypothetical protein C922_01944 [Plasmodium inui San Antonio 1]
MFPNPSPNYEKLKKVEKSFDETNDTVGGSISRLYTIDGYTSESIGITQPQYKEYYSYPNAIVQEYEPKSNTPSMTFGCPGNPFSCKPPNAKVFIRRVENKKRKVCNKKCTSLNSSFSQDINPFVVYPSNSINENNVVGELGYTMPLNDTDKNVPFGGNYVPDKNSRLTYAYLSDDLNYSLNGQFMNMDTPYMNVPLCVRESFQNNDPCNVINAGYPLLRDGQLHLNKGLPQEMDVTCHITPKDVVTYIHNFIKYIFKVIKLAFAKINKDLNTKEIYFDPTIPPVHEMDIDCEVCRKKYGDIFMDKHRRDCISFFEGVDESRTIFNRIWDLINNWMDGKDTNKMDFLKDREKIKEMVQQNRKEFEEVYYKLGNFPKDENGKIELPQFSNFERNSVVLM